MNVATQELNALFCIFCRWYNLSSKSTPQSKQQDAIDNIRYYYAHVFNGVCKPLKHTDYIHNIMVSASERKLEWLLRYTTG
jgi:hypothetical protein